MAELKITEEQEEKIENCLRTFGMMVFAHRIIREEDIKQCLDMIEVVLSDGH